MGITTNINGTYSNVNKVYVNVGGTWIESEKGFVRVAGTWEEFYTKVVQYSGALPGTFTAINYSQGHPSNLNNGNYNDYCYGSNMKFHYDHGSPVAIKQFNLVDMYFTYISSSWVDWISIYGSNSPIPNSGGNLLYNNNNVHNTLGDYGDRTNLIHSMDGWIKVPFNNTQAYQYYRIEQDGIGIREIVSV